MFHLHELVLWFGSDFLVEAMPSPEATKKKRKVKNAKQRVNSSLKQLYKVIFFSKEYIRKLLHPLNKLYIV